MNEGCRVGSSRNKVEADDVCAQDLSNTQSVDALVAGSLRVQQLYGDKDKGKRLKTVSRIGANDGPTRSSGQWVGTRDGTTKSKSNTDCCVNC